MQAICATYLAAPTLYQEYGTHTVSTDEMTGIQALERIAPTKGIQPGQECSTASSSTKGTARSR